MKRNLARVNEHSAQGAGQISWFKLDANLTEFGNALAYACDWNSDARKWIERTDSTKRIRVYSTIEKATGSRFDFVPCWYNPRGRIWEVLKQKPDGQQSLYYYLYKKVKGFGTDIGGFGTAILDSTHTVAWPGAAYVVGDEEEVGIEFDDSETDPDTNGNFLVTKTGVFRIEYSKYFKVRLGSSGAATLMTLLTQCSVYRKPVAGGPNDALVDQLNGDPLLLFDNLQEPETGITLQRHALGGGMFYATAGDRLSFRIQISSLTSIPASCAVSWNFPIVTFTYLQAANMLAEDETF